MGEVYEARDHRLGRRVALKFLPHELSSDARAVERLQREARIASSLNHPHICTIHDIDSHHGTHFIVMELLDGVPLKQRIQVGALPVREVILIGVHVAEALGAAHKLGIVHRDIKPANIFLTSRGLVKVLDFGVAKLQGPRPSPVTSSVPVFNAAPDALTTDGVALGTIQYMSPEQARGEPIDGRSDLFSLGSVMYEMATGVPAFSGATPAVIFDTILNREPPAPGTLNPAVPPELDRIVARAMAKAPADRYQSADDLIADLERMHRELSGEVPIGRTAEYLTRPTRRSSSGPLSIGTVQTTSHGRRRAIFLGGGAVLLALAGAAYWSTQRAHQLTEQDTIVIADFANTTGDPVFDAALPEAVDVQIRQSRWFRVLSEQRTAATLRLMGRAPDTPVTGDLARELCQRADADAVIGGTIASIGSTYVITLDAQHCATGDSLAKEQAQASSKDLVLAELGNATSRLRKELGESLQSVERFDTPIQAATTPSLPALKAYSLGVRARVRNGDSAAIPFFRQALELDPAFGLAHARLSVVYENLGDRALARAEAEKAYELREKVSEYERLYIVTRYHDVVTGDLDKRIEALRLMGDTFARDFAPRNNLGVAYLEIGRLDQAADEFRKAVALAPDQRVPSMNLGNTLVNLGKLDEAQKVFEQTLAIGDSSDLRAGAFMRAYFAGDRDAMAREYEAGRRGGEPWLLSSVRALTLAYEGKLEDAERVLSQGIADAAGANRAGALARGYLQLAWIALQCGDLDSARDSAEQALVHDRDARTVLQAAAILAMAGDRSTRPAALIAPFESDTQLGTITRDVFLAQARAALALTRGDAAGAHAILDPSTAYEPHYPELTWMRGIAHLRAGDPAAADDFRTLLEHPWRGGSVVYPLVHLQLARALAKAGNRTEAAAEYDRFLAAWAQADADATPLSEARRERAALSSS